MNLICYFDGSCTPRNPGGDMGWGAIVKDQQGNIIHQSSGKKPAASDNTNNVAEYMGLQSVLNHLFDKWYEGDDVLIRGDSMMVCMQMMGKWRIKDGYYKETAIECLNNLDFLKEERELNISFEWIPRNMNEEADLLSNPERIPFIHRKKHYRKQKIVPSKNPGRNQNYCL